MAEWCAEHGLEAERQKHLGIALLLKPSHAKARALLGLEPRAATPEETAREAALAEYREKVAKKEPKTADDHWALALWAQKKGLKVEETSHLWSVVSLDRKREAAWKRLGYKSHNGRWMLPEQIAAEKAEKEAQEAAEKHWKPVLEKWKAALSGDKAERKQEAIRGLTDLDDPRAVPLVAKLFARGSASDQTWAVQVLGRVETPVSTRALALLTMLGKSTDVRRAAAESLRTRDPRDFVPLLVSLLREPLKYEVRPVNGPGQPGVLFIEGTDSRLRRFYAPPTLADVGSLLDSGLLPRGLAVSQGYGPSAISSSMTSVGPPGGLVDKNGNAGHFVYIAKKGSLLDPDRIIPRTVLLAFGVSPSAMQFHTYAAAPAVNAPTTPLNLPGNVGAAFAKAVPGGGSAAVQQQLLGQMAEQAVQYQVMAQIQRQLEYEWAVAETMRMTQVAKAQQLNDVAAIERSNKETDRLNDFVSAALVASTGQDFGADREAWTKWWKERAGYVYKPPGPRIKPTLFESMALNVSSAPPVVGRATTPACAHRRGPALGGPARDAHRPRRGPESGPGIRGYVGQSCDQQSADGHDGREGLHVRRHARLHRRPDHPLGLRPPRLLLRRLHPRLDPRRPPDDRLPPSGRSRDGSRRLRLGRVLRLSPAPGADAPPADRLRGDRDDPDPPVPRRRPRLDRRGRPFSRRRALFPERPGPRRVDLRRRASGRLQPPPRIGLLLPRRPLVGRGPRRQPHRGGRRRVEPFAFAPSRLSLRERASSCATSEEGDLLRSSRGRHRPRGLSQDSAPPDQKTSFRGAKGDDKARFTSLPTPPRRSPCTPSPRTGATRAAR